MANRLIWSGVGRNGYAEVRVSGGGDYELEMYDEDFILVGFARHDALIDATADATDRLQADVEAFAA
ncbi:MAG TPA: hypothetical protein VM305_11790 [Candidatus Limnocylindrales bacterium]|nr:hypothetical protein [Candidatus Limnocylindrales bacterium]